MPLLQSIFYLLGIGHMDGSYNKSERGNATTALQEDATEELPKPTAKEDATLEKEKMQLKQEAERLVNESNELIDELTTEHPELREAMNTTSSPQSRPFSETMIQDTIREAGDNFPDVARYVVDSLVTDPELIQKKFPIQKSSIENILDVMTFVGILGRRMGGYYAKLRYTDNLRPYIRKGMEYFGSRPQDEDEDSSGRSRHIPQSVRDAVWRRAKGRCEECGSRANLEFDHIVPFSKGGSNTYRNVQLLCQNCNRHKSDHIG